MHRRTIIAASLGILLSLVFASNALAVRIIDVNTGQEVALASGASVPANANLRFEAEDGGTHEWYVYVGSTLLARSTDSSVTFGGNPSYVGMQLQVSQGAVWSGGYRLVDPTDVPAPITLESPASGQLSLPGAIGIYSPKPSLSLRVRGGPSDLPIVPCPAGLRPGTRCFSLEWAPLGPIEVEATARGTATGSPDIQRFPLNVVSNVAPTFTRPVAAVGFRRKNGACQAQAAVVLTAREAFVLQGEYRLEARMDGRWKQLLAKRQRLNGQPGYDDQVLISTASLKGSAVKAAIASRTKFRLRSSFLILRDGTAQVRSKLIKKSVNMRSCR